MLNIISSLFKLENWMGGAAPVFWIKVVILGLLLSYISLLRTELSTLTTSYNNHVKASAVEVSLLQVERNTAAQLAKSCSDNTQDILNKSNALVENAKKIREEIKPQVLVKTKLATKILTIYSEVPTVECPSGNSIINQYLKDIHEKAN